MLFNLEALQHVKVQSAKSASGPSGCDVTQCPATASHNLSVFQSRDGVVYSCLSDLWIALWQENWFKQDALVPVLFRQPKNVYIKHNDKIISAIQHGSFKHLNSVSKRQLATLTVE